LMGSHGFDQMVAETYGSNVVPRLLNGSDCARRFPIATQRRLTCSNRKTGPRARAVAHSGRPHMPL